MTGDIWKSAFSSLKKILNLANSPVGVKMFTEAKELLKFADVKLLTKTTPCHMAAIARYHREQGIVGASSEGIRCVLGSSCIGLIRAPNRVVTGTLNLPFVKDANSAENLQRSIKMIGAGGKKYSAVLMAPLDLIPADPDLVVIYATPAQVLRMIIGFTYWRGDAISTTMTGQGSLCAAIAKILEGQKVVIDIPCLGDRAYGLVKEEEMLFAFSADVTTEFLEGLRRTESIASHPFKPFLSWPVVLPPDFDVRPNELG
ncbi:MAG: DUF169 domain-containing protein [Methanomassiliicoccales archaeon]|jgi:uncharacterized protein (DUF169 family)|nr:DUF169 domain-containing protein [Methanomassiliicoccales archaeon]